MGKKLLLSSNPNELFQDINKDNNDLKIFTDGSKNLLSKAVGTACICPELDIKIFRSISKFASIFTAESIAVYDAVSIASENSNRFFHIYTDSLSVLYALCSQKINVNTNHYVLKIKEKLEKQENVKLFWIPAHKGIIHNEEADILAKKATENDPSDLPIPYTDLKSIFKKNAVIKNNLEVLKQGSIKGVNYFKMFYKHSSKPWFHNLNIERDLIVTINRSRADHYSLNYSLCKINVVNDPKCECGFEIQDLNHIIWQCSMYNDYRLELIKKLTKYKILLPQNINSFLVKPNIVVFKVIMDFLKKCKLKI